MTILLPKEQHLAQAGLANLPPGWSVIELGTLLSEARGVSVGVMYPGDHDPSGVPLIKVGDLGGSEINESPPFRISHQVHQEYRRTALEGGELLLTLVGAVGQCAIVPSSMKGWNAARAIAVLRFRNPEDAEFVRLCLLSEPLQYLMNAWSNTTVQTTLNLKEVRLLPLPWPGDTHERRRIAATFGCLDDKLRLNRRMNQTLEALAAAIFKAWFIDFEPVKAKAAGAKSFPSMPQPVFDALPSSLVPAPNSPSGEIPKGWTCVSLPELVDVNPSRALSKGVLAPYLDMSNMPTNGHAPEGWIQREAGSGMRFRNGDTLVARITPCLENGKTAFVDFLAEGQVGWGSTEYIVLRPKHPLPTVWGYCLARSEGFREFAIQRMTGSSGRQRVPSESLSQFWFAKAPEALAVSFAEIVEPLFVLAKSNMDENRSLRATRDLLLPRLLSGEVRVATAELHKEAAGV